MNPILLDFPEEVPTDRLILRPPRMGDAAALSDAITASLPRLKPWMPWAMSEPITVPQRAAWCQEAYAKFLLRQDMPLLITDRGTGRILGGSGLHRLDWSVPAMEIGYWIRTGDEGKGYVTEAVQA